MFQDVDTESALTESLQTQMSLQSQCTEATANPTAPTPSTSHTNGNAQQKEGTYCRYRSKMI